jgi:hypothetical protein
VSVLQRLGGIFDYEVKKERLEEVLGELEDPAVWNEPDRAQACCCVCICVGVKLTALKPS